MDRRALLALCLAEENVYEDYPFDDDNWACVRHRGNRKIFAMVYRRGGHLCVNLKCEPMRADFYRSVYAGVAPGFHMNHQHWNTVTMGMDVPMDELRAMVRESWRLTAPKARKKAKAGEKAGTKE